MAAPTDKGAVFLKEEALAWFQKGSRQAFQYGQELFEDYLGEHRDELQQRWQRDVAGLRRRGIVIAAGSRSMLANAFVNVYVLRHWLKSELPVAIM